jgi:hypothetical protein
MIVILGLEKDNLEMSLLGGEWKARSNLSGLRLF